MAPVARIRYKDQWVDMLTAGDDGRKPWNLRQQYEAETALGMTMDGSNMAAVEACLLFLSIRRVDPDIPAVQLADMVLGDTVFTKVDEDEGEDPTVAGEEPGNGHADPASIGPPISASSGSPSPSKS